MTSRGRLEPSRKDQKLSKKRNEICSNVTFLSSERERGQASALIEGKRKSSGDQKNPNIMKDNRFFSET